MHHHQITRGFNLCILFFFFLSFCDFHFCFFSSNRQDSFSLPLFSFILFFFSFRSRSLEVDNEDIFIDLSSLFLFCYFLLELFACDFQYILPNCWRDQIKALKMKKIFGKRKRNQQQEKIQPKKCIKSSFTGLTCFLVKSNNLIFDRI